MVGVDGSRMVMRTVNGKREGRRFTKMKMGESEQLMAGEVKTDEPGNKKERNEEPKNATTSW